MIVESRHLARTYLLLLGAGLLLEGAALLVVAAINLPVPNALDNPHNALHVLWGLLILGVLATSRDSSLVSLAVLFGVFYVGLAFAGMVLVKPFGLLFGPGENLSISWSVPVRWSRPRYCNGARATLLFDLVAVTAEGSSWLER